nr:hypothetical protein [Tanacetum cinerariifolium]
MLPVLKIVFKIKDTFRNKQYKPEDIQELFCELFNDVQNIHEELAEYIHTPGWNRPAFYNNGDDDDEDCTIAITPDFLFTNSLIMGDEHLDTIPEKQSDEFIKSSVENLVPNPSEFEVECECDVPDCDDSQTKNFSTFSNPLFDDSTSSDDESSHEEVILEMSFKTYPNPLFDLDDEIILTSTLSNGVFLGFRLKIPLRVFLFMIRVKEGRPMGLRDYDTWVWVQGNGGCWDKGIGTVSVKGSIREKCREKGRVLVGNLVTGWLGFWVEAEMAPRV